MTVAATKDLQTHLRATYVRLAPARSMTSSLALVAGVYQCAWTRPVAEVRRNGVALTLDAAIPSTNDHYWFDEASQLFYVKLASAPSDTTNVIALFYYLFMTSGPAILANETPTDAATTLRQWEPRLSVDPNIRQSVQNVFVGVLTIDSVPLSLNNADGFFNQFFTIHDSFNEKSADIWIGLRPDEATAPDFQFIYSGKVKDATLSRTSLELTALDPLSRLNQPQYMGDTADEAIVQLTATSYPNADPRFIGRAVPYFAGSYSRHQFMNEPLTAPAIGKNPHPDSLAEAFSDSYNPNVGFNLTWDLGRISADGTRSWSVPVGDAVSNPHGGGYFSAEGDTYQMTYKAATWATITDVHFGDRVKIVVGAVTAYGRVWIMDATNYQIVFALDRQHSATALATTTPTITCYSDPFVVIKSSRSGYAISLSPERDFTTTLTATSGGNYLVQITLTATATQDVAYRWFYDPATGVSQTGQWATYETASGLDPNSHTVLFRLRMVTTNHANHADFLGDMLTGVGLAKNAASLATAKAALAVNVGTQIPYGSENSYRAAVDYMQDLLVSTLSILYFGSGGDGVYQLLANPSSTDEANDDTTVRDSDSIQIQYSDIVSQVIASNEHMPTNSDLVAGKSPNETRTNALATYLHGVVDTWELSHVLETITDRIDYILLSRAQRLATYAFDVEAKYIDATLGQNVKRAGSLLLGADTARSVKIVTLDRSAEKTTVGAVDLLGVF